MKLKRIMGTLCVFALVAAMLPFAALGNSDIAEEADAYFYDRISKQAQECYDYLKNYYDEKGGTEALEKIDFTHLWAPKTEDGAKSLGTDFIIADMALKADDPRYVWKGRVAGYGSSYSPLQFTLDIECYGLLSQEMDKQQAARLKQIVDSVGDADRYTKLRKMTDILLDSAFYDPYQAELNSSGNYTPATIGHHYNHAFYGVLLKNIAVCDGFSQVVKVLCDAMDIPCVIMGNASHAWNMVQMEDGGWYRLDITNACRLGIDGELPNTKELYFRDIFLNNNSMGPYSDPYMLSVENYRFTDLPVGTFGQYRYTGTTTDFSYTLAPSEYTAPAGIFRYRVNADGKTCTITAYEGAQAGDLTIPSQLDDYTVTAIDPYAFYYCTGFVGKLTVPETVVSIGKAAFLGCSGLSEASLPETLKELGEGAFAGCKSLSAIKLPQLLRQIDPYTFFDCTALETVTFGGHIQQIAETAFDKVSASLTLCAPAESVVQVYAAAQGKKFRAEGEACSLEPAGGSYGIRKEGHFQYCQHGVALSTVPHATETGAEPVCGDTCAVCGAQYCEGFGYAEDQFFLDSARPANCLEPEFTGNLICACGILIQPGEFVGEPTTEHVAEPGVAWEHTDSYHYKTCVCLEAQVEKQPHSGGAGVTAVCSVCGATYTNTQLVLWICAAGGVVILGGALAVIFAVKKKKKS